MRENKRFRKGYVLGDTGLIDELGNPKWFIENINSVSDLQKNWDTVIDKLNQVWKQTQRFEKHNTRLTEENIRYEEHIEDLTQENKKLQSINQDHRDYIGDVEADFKRLEQHNKELQERNNRQAKQLDKVYKLMEKQDYKALQNIIQDFKEAEELLKQEWKCFDD